MYQRFAFFKQVLVGVFSVFLLFGLGGGSSWHYIFRSLQYVFLFSAS